MTGKGFQHGKFAGRKRHGFAVFAQFATAEVEFKLAEYHYFLVQRRGARFIGARTAAKHGVDAGEQFARIEGLGDVIVGTEFQTDDAIDVFATGGEHQHRRHVLACTQTAQNLQAVFAGQHQVENECIEAFAHPDAVHRRSAVGHRNAKAVIAEITAQQVAKTGIVVNNQNLRRAFLFSHVTSFSICSGSHCGPALRIGCHLSKRQK